MTARFPELMRIRQEFERPIVRDIPKTVTEELEKSDLRRTVQPGQSVAITAGSRGIANITEMTRAIVQYVRQLAAEPFIVPAMGSHGGATAEGQINVLGKLGITESSVGCPIRSSMDTRSAGTGPGGFDLHIDQHAFEADHVLIWNRVKPHTSIAGDLESGLVKMLLIGLGKHLGAQIMHRALVDYSFSEIASAVVPGVIERCKVRGGLAIVENAYEETALIEGVSASQLVEREKQLLLVAKRLIARIPFDDIDVLLVDEMGKNISGTGMDTNVIGRKSNDHVALQGETPRIKRICVRSLTEPSAGNATGIGIAEFCLSQLLQQMDRKATRINCLTSLHPTGGMIPMDFANDREMLDAAFSTVGLRAAEESRFVWIANTLELEYLVCSKNYLDPVRDHPSLEIVDQDLPMRFDESGHLQEVFGR